MFVILLVIGTETFESREEGVARDLVSWGGTALHCLCLGLRKMVVCVWYAYSISREPKHASLRAFLNIYENCVDFFV